MTRRCGERRQANGNVEMFRVERAETEEKVEETSQHIIYRRVVCTEEVCQVTVPVVSLDDSLEDPDVVVVESDNIPEGPEWSGRPHRMSCSGSLVCVPEPGDSGSSLVPAGLADGGLQHFRHPRTGAYDEVHTATSGESRVMSGEH